MTDSKKTVSGDDRKLIVQSLNLLSASFQRSITAAVKANDEVLENHYRKLNDRTLVLRGSIENLELF